MFCKKCGSEIDADSNYCSFCGLRIVYKIVETEVPQKKSSDNKQESVNLEPHTKKTISLLKLLGIIFVVVGLGYILWAELKYQDYMNKYKACVTRNDQYMRQGLGLPLNYCQMPERIEVYKLNSD